MMREAVSTLIVVGICIAAVVILGASVYEKIRNVEILKDDHPLEELTEEAIKQQLGADVDLSPFSEEK